MFRTAMLALGLILTSVSAFAKDYPDGSGTSVPGAAIVCSDTTTPSNSGPCGTAAHPMVVTPGSTPVGGGLTPVKSSAAETGHVLKAAAGSLVSLTVTTGAAAGYAMVHNSATVPSAGAVTPVYCWQVPANGSLAMAWPVSAEFSTGISASFSTTGCFTQTNSATAFFSGQVN